MGDVLIGAVSVLDASAASLANSIIGLNMQFAGNQIFEQSFFFALEVDGVCSRIFAARPTHLLPSLRAGDFRLGDLVREQFLEGFGNLLWWSSFDDFSLRQPMAEQLLEVARPRQADVVGQPFRLLAQAWGKGPMHDEAGVSSLPLYSVQGALLPGE